MTTRTEDQIDHARRELRALLQRREFLALTGGVLASVTGLAGCGSDPTGPGPNPPGSIPDGMHAAAGTVSLPPGASLGLATMTVDVAGQAATVSAAGEFAVGISPVGPSLALLLDANGDPVYSAIFDPTVSSYAVSSRSTAVAFLYYAVGACYYPPAVSSRILALLKTDPSVNAIDAAVAAAVSSDPHAVVNGATPIGNAVGAALRQIFPASLRAEPTPAPLRTVTVPTLLLVTPSGSQDGISVDQDPAGTAVIVTNTWRRSAKVYLYRVSTQTGTQVADIRPAERVSGPIDLDSTENISLFTALKDIVKGTSPASPISLPSMPLELKVGTDRTSYQVVIIEASATTHTPLAGEPGFYSDPHYVNELAGWRREASDLFNDTIVGELAMPLFCLMGGFGAIALTHKQLTAAVRAGNAAFAATRTAIIANLEFGSMGKLSASLIRALRATMANDIMATASRNQVKALLGAIDAKALQAQTTAELAARLSKGVSMFLKVFEVVAGVGIVLDAFDTGLIMTHFISSNIGVRWDATVIRQILNLTPQSPIVASGDRVPFQVSNPVGAQAGNYEYDWSHNSAFATLSAVGEVNVGNAITTAKRNVDLVTTPSDVNPVIVSVVGYDKSSGQRVEIGRAATAVTFIQRALITPSGAFVDMNGHQTFVVSLAGDLPAGAQYQWTLTGGLGSIGATATVTTTVPQIDFAAGVVGGLANLHVDVSVPNAGTVAKGDAAINIAGPSKVNILITGPGWDPERTPANGNYAYTDDYGYRGPVPEVGNPNDVIFIEYNLGLVDQTIGVLITMVLPRGAIPITDQNFTKVPAGVLTIAPGQWQLTMATNQLDPDDEDSRQYAIAGTGSLKVDAIGKLPNGTWVMNYSAVLSNGAGGVVVVQGTGRFK